MSALALSQSVVPNNTSTFPKEATIQHLFMASLLSLTPINVKILPELGKTYPLEGVATSTAIQGEIDFYIRNCDFSWGIELLVEGRGVGEHVHRFGPDGKYWRLGTVSRSYYHRSSARNGKSCSDERSEENDSIFRIRQF
jgi:hypothetical protein